MANVKRKDNRLTCFVRAWDSTWKAEDKQKIIALTKDKGEWFTGNKLFLGDSEKVEYYKFVLLATRPEGAVKEVKNILKHFSSVCHFQFHYGNDRIHIHEIDKDKYTVHTTGKNHKTAMPKLIDNLKECELVAKMEPVADRVKFELTPQAKKNWAESLRAIANLCP